MIRSPDKQYSSNPDISNLAETSRITFRKRKYEEDMSDAFKDFASEIKTTLHSWKDEIQGNMMQMNSGLESVLKTDLDKLNTSFSEIKAEISDMRQEYQEIKKSMQSLDLKHSNTMQQVEVLEKSVQFYSDQYELLNKKIESLETGKKNVESMESRIEALANENKLLQLELNSNNQRDRLLNLEIVGVPELKDENLCNIVLLIAKHANVSISPQDVTEVHRITPRIKQQGRPRNIIVKVTSRLLKDNILSGFRKNAMNNQDLGFQGNVGRVYVNEHLTQYNKFLLKQCRETAKNKGYQYTWTKNGRIFVRKNDLSPAFQVTQEKDFLKIV
jgi:prefoldin subunit 5